MRQYVKPITKLIKLSGYAILAGSPDDPAATRPEDSATKKDFLSNEEDATAPQKSVWQD